MEGFALDLLTRVVNVHWAGGAFILGDDAGQIWVSDGSAETPLQRVYTIGSPHAGTPPGLCRSSSSAVVEGVSAIIVGGHKHAFDHRTEDGTEIGHYTIGCIEYSEDGQAWSTVLDMTADSSLTTSTTVVKMIWDDKFYSMVQRDLAEGGFATECWSSADGRTWDMGGSQYGGINDEFESHCKYKDASHIGLADGEFGVDPSKKHSEEAFPFGEVIEDGLLITRDDMSNCPVIFAGGQWARANYTENGKLETSTDSGENWTEIGAIGIYDPDLSHGVITTLIGTPG